MVPISENDVIDLIHATMPLNCCDFELLDARWVERIDKMKRRLAKSSMIMPLARSMLLTAEQWHRSVLEGSRGIRSAGSTAAADSLAVGIGLPLITDLDGLEASKGSRAKLTPNCRLP